MRTSEVAAQAQVNTQTLRYYERRGLLPEPERTRSGYRAYTRDAVRVVRLVKCAQQFGFTLHDIEDLLHLADGGPASCEEATTMARTRIADLPHRRPPAAHQRTRRHEGCAHPAGRHL
ncbi:MAG TPA: MerR family transcriptional regulator [Mycobacterium sp.]|nr:MerR family transcriptional regulator [Mycobacterium sp.]